MESMKRLLYWLLEGSKGGPTRIAILKILAKKPMNMRQLSLAADMDYKTMEHHVLLMLKNSVLDQVGDGYGKVYFISDMVMAEKDFKELLYGDGDGGKGKKKKG